MFWTAAYASPFDIWYMQICPAMARLQQTVDAPVGWPISTSDDVEEDVVVLYLSWSLAGS